MWCCRPTSLLALALAACSEVALVPVDEGAEPEPPRRRPAVMPESPPPDDPPDTGEVVVVEPTPERPCHAGTLGPEDALPLSPPDADDPETDDYTDFFSQAVPTSAAGEPAAWARSGRFSSWDTVGEEYGGMYLLTAADWASPILPGDRRPRITGGSIEDIHLMDGNLTVDPAAPGEGLWLWQVHDGRAGADVLANYWLFPSTPGAPVTQDDAPARIDAAYSERAEYADLDGDGLDDAWIRGHPGVVFLAPFSGTLAWSDGDVVMPETLAGVSDWIGGVDMLLTDLDGDGTVDLLYGGGDEATDELSVQVKAGPLLGLDEGDAPDGAYVISARDAQRVGGQDMCSPTGCWLNAVGDVTGDGRPDVTAGHAGVDEIAPDRVVLFVLDHMPVGNESYLDLPTKILGTTSADGTDGSQVFMGPAGAGDFNGDGWPDLVAAHEHVTHVGGPTFRAHALPGPLDGTIYAEDAGVRIDIPAGTWVSGGGPTTGAILVPDMDLDGFDDILMSTEATDEDPARLWLFYGCEDW